MTNSKLSVWPLRLILVLSLIGPAIVLAYVALANHAAIDKRSTERIERALDSIQEHALKVLQTVDRSIAETNAVLNGLSDEGIRRDEERLSARLKRTQEALVHVQSVWAFDQAGRPLVSSTILPVPRDLNNSDRDYFRAHVDRDVGLFIGDIVIARVGNLRFFVVSARRPERPDGTFNGVIGVTVLPAHFREYYGRLAGSVADSFGLIRADGAFLARYPQVLDRPERLGPGSEFLNAIQTNPDAGLFKVVSQLDGVERRIGYRKVPGFPVYVQAGIETGAMRRELRDVLLGHIAFGLPATLSMFGLAFYSLRRTKKFQEEVIRREAAESALKQAQRLEAMGQLTGGVAHDFNNLLMVIDGNAQRLKKHPALDDRQTRALESISAAVTRGASLTRQLLSFSRRQTHQRTAITIADRLSALEDLLVSSVRSDIVISFHTPGDIWPIEVDVDELELAILNLTVNARDAMPNGGQLMLAAQNLTFADAGTIGMAGDFVAVSIADTGAGIPPEVISRVFEPFFTTKEVGKGTGLGLSQVYGFAQQSGGTAKVSSVPGRGTTVTLYLPRSSRNTVPPASASIEGSAPLHLPARGRVLLVEDNADVAEVAKSHLETIGYKVDSASNSENALAALEKDAGSFDLLITDIVMPGQINGLDLAQRVRRLYGRKIAILITTGYSDVAQSAADQGWPVLRKPYDVVTLKDMIARALRASRPRSVKGSAVATQAEVVSKAY